jgi:GLPGLI family protein
MRKLIFFVLIFSTKLIAQQKTVEVDYIVKQTLLKSVVLEYDGNLKYNDSISVYFFDRASRRTPNADEELGDFVALAPSSYTNFKDYTIYKNGTNYIKFTKQINKRNYLVQDTFPKLAWNITSEEKKIEGFNCNKATVDFRGRKYIAWFSAALPCSFGPWKFNGLPGLILEVYDTELLFTWQARKIKTKEQNLLAPRLNDKIISIKESETIMEKYLEAKFEVTKSKHPPGSVTRTKGKLMELKFEWEEKQSK